MSLPERTFAKILVLVSEKAPDYSWSSNNCYWYAGSVYETLRVGLKGYTEVLTDEWKHRGEVQVLWWWVSVGDDPTTVSIPEAIAVAAPPPGAPQELPHDRVIREFGTPENLNAYRLLHEKNIGPMQMEFDDPLEEKLTIALRGLVGHILHSLAGPLLPGQKFEDLPVLSEWLKQASDFRYLSLPFDSALTGPGGDGEGKLVDFYSSATT
ncbi:hypothetical protein ONZ45_g19516 [Pleurotus djamor]|nr:hypothetical protein ONZ45_g19516 [Pleurotus djamor]